MNIETNMNPNAMSVIGDIEMPEEETTMIYAGTLGCYSCGCYSQQC